jgi:uncharacterized alkaline shock family protein YloU
LSALSNPTTDPQAKLAISQDVLYGIAQLALETLEGLKPVAPPARMGEILTGRRAKGIRIERHSGAVTIDLNVRVTFGLAIPALAKEAQKVVREAVTSMTGLMVASVNVTVEAVDLPAPETLVLEQEPRGEA